MTIEAIILWIGATVSLTLQYVSWENCHSSLQWVGWLNSETLRIIIEQSDWVTVRRHCNTFWHFMINFQVFGKSCLDALLIRNKIKIAVILWLSEFLLFVLKSHRSQQSCVCVPGMGLSFTESFVLKSQLSQLRNQPKPYQLLSPTSSAVSQNNNKTSIKIRKIRWRCC